MPTTTADALPLTNEDWDLLSRAVATAIDKVDSICEQTTPRIPSLSGPVGLTALREKIGHDGQRAADFYDAKVFERHRATHLRCEAAMRLLYAARKNLSPLHGDLIRDITALLEQHQREAHPLL